MTHLSYTEDTLDDVKAFILANLQTYLSGILAIKGDSRDIPLDMFEDEQILIGESDVGIYDNYPMMFINPMEDKFEYLASGIDTLQTQAVISVVVSGYEEATLMKMCMRYGAAMRNMIRENTTFDNAVDEIAVDTIVYIQNILGAPELSGVNIIIYITKQIVI